MLHARQGKGNDRPSTSVISRKKHTLAFHGMRASHPDFDVTLESTFPSSFRRWNSYNRTSAGLLNLLNNAFTRSGNVRKERTRVSSHRSYSPR